MPNLIKKEYQSSNACNCSPPLQQSDIQTEHTAQFIVFPPYKDENPATADETIDECDLFLSILLKLSKDLAMVRTRADLSQALENGWRRILKYNHAIVLHLSTDQKWLLPFLGDLGSSGVIHTAYYEAKPNRFKVSRKFMDRVFQNMKPHVFDLNGSFEENDYPEFFFMNPESDLKEVLVVGLGDVNNKIGLIAFFSLQQNNFGPDVVDIVSRFSSQLSAAVINIMSADQIIRQAAEISGYKKQLETENIYIQKDINVGRQYDEMIGESVSLNKVLNLVFRVADTNSSVLILGETGTGKELIARAIHNASSRKDKLMIKVNCAALPANLIESELFGHEKGSFTGAIETRIGKFELAHNSTLFLDEIGELPLELQAKLLRVIQEKEFERVGGRATIKANVRILAATNRDLQQEVFLGHFRSDLFYRLNVFPISVPPLRERIEDIPMLAAHFLSRQAKKINKNVVGFTSEVMEELTGYCWPGNIRELENLVERSVLMASRPFISEVCLPGKSGMAAIVGGPSGDTIKPLEEVEKAHILGVLRYCNWRVKGNGGAAELLQLPTSTLNSKIKRFRLRK